MIYTLHILDVRFKKGRPYSHHNVVRSKYCSHQIWCGVDIVRTKCGAE